MIVTNCFSGGFPNLFLWIHLWAGHWKEHYFQTRISLQQLFHEWAAMPTRSIPEEQDRTIRIGLQDFLQVLCCHFRIHHQRPHGYFLPSQQIERAIETKLFPTRSHSNDRGLPDGRPGWRCRSLQIQTGFIFSKNDRIRSILCHIN